MKFLKWFVVLAILGAGGWFAWKFYSAKGIEGEALQLIPDDAIFAMITDRPIDAWREITKTNTWKFLNTNSYVSSLTASANSVDSLIQDNKLLFDAIGTRTLIMSAHMIGTKDYDFLFLVDLQGASGLKFLNEYITPFKLKREKYYDNDIIIVHDEVANTNLYISMPGTFLLMSYTKKVLINALDAQLSGATLNKDRLVPVDLSNKSIGQFYLNYNKLPEFVRSYSDTENEYAYAISRSLISTNLDLVIEDDVLKAHGYTYVNDSVESYVRTLEVSGKGPTKFTEIAPLRTAFVLSLGFDSFSGFFSKFQDNIKKDVKEYEDYRNNLSTVEKYLRIDLQKQVIDWIGDEVAFIELQSSGKGTDTEMAIILKSNDIEKAKKDLGYIERQVRKKTPVKFKSIDHRGYAINYLGVKGMFKILLGKFFARYDKPYYTVINNFVIFSNHPQTLESMVDDYLDKKTLDQSDEFNEFRKRFDDKSSVFIYVNTPVMFNTMKTLVDIETRKDLDNNKPYIVCFRHIGFQMVPEHGRFKTGMAEQFVIEVPDVEKEVDVETDSMKLPYIYVKDVNAKSYTDYYGDSTVHFTVELKNGFKDGSFVEYYENGKERMTGKFNRDKRDGHWRLYNQDGDLVMRRTYDNGIVKRERDQ